MKRNVLIRVSAIFVLLWYSLGIIGFNVHTCNARDRSFIVSFLEDMSCESIHPSDDSGDGQVCCCCCSHHTPEMPAESDESVDDPECCTDDYHVLTSLTDRADDTKRFHIFDVIPFCVMPSDMDDAVSALHCSLLRSCSLSRVLCDTQGLRVLCNVWRI